MELISVKQLLQVAGDSPVSAYVDAQVQANSYKNTRAGKPYLELGLADSTGNFTLKIWSDRSQFAAAQGLKPHHFIRLSGEWTQNQYGIDSAHWDFRNLEEHEVENFLTGDAELAEKQKNDWQTIEQFTGAIQDPRLKTLCGIFCGEFGARFRRTAAARKNHHARRGGLVEHVAQMMRLAASICGVYPELNRDLLIASILFHDAGKLWENTYPEKGFNQSHNMHGEMLGHITLGIELVNALWRPMCKNHHDEEWKHLEPQTEDVRLHLLHLIASHHGTHEFGSPALPRTPEALALHYIDNLDAKMEMMKDAYATSELLAPGIYQRMFPLPSNVVDPLPHFHAEETPTPEAETGSEKIDETPEPSPAPAAFL